jgi:imidazolonepropionase-like amidohydrolase
MNKTFFHYRLDRGPHRLKCSVTLALALTCIITNSGVLAQQRNQSQLSSTVIETGKFQFYETKLVQGEETYEITSAADGSREITAKTDLPDMQEEEPKPWLQANLRTGNDLSPSSFQIKGIRLLGVPINLAISVDQKAATASVATPDAASGDPTLRGTVPVAKNSFVFGGYLPVTMEMMLVRYWLAHGRPARLGLLPRGEAIVEYRARDFVTVGNRRQTLERYHLSGKLWGGGWGRQTLWLDAQQRLIAAVNLATDVETNLTAIREGYDSQLSFFLKRAVEDQIDRLTQLANELSPPSTRPLALLGGTIIDVTGKPPIEDSAVVIQGDRIIAAGPRAQVKIPAGAVTENATGKFLVPGLWDMHAHMYQAEFGPVYVALGITTARDVGNEIEYGTTMRDAAKQGRGLGPRMLLAGYIDGKAEGFDVQVDTPAEARAAVQRYKTAGFEQMKIRDNVKPEILKVITSEAHRLGMTVTGHVPKGMNALQAVEAGMDQLDHLNFVETAFAPELPRGQPLFEVDLNAPASKNALEVFRQHGTVIHPTNAVLELMIRPMNLSIESFEPGIAKVAPELLEQINKKGAPAEAADQINAAMATLLKVTLALHRAGIPLTAGTDVGVPGFTLDRELEFYVKAGLTPLEALQTATITPARVMKLDGEVGTIEAGKRADIVILAGNPLENISNIRKVKFVVAGGRLFDSSKLREAIGFKP